MGDLAGWRDASIVLLSLEAFLVGLPIAVAGYYLLRYLAHFRHWLATQFPMWQAATVRGRDCVERYMRFAIVPIIAVAALASAVGTVVSLISSPRSNVWRRSYRE